MKTQFTKIGVLIIALCLCCITALASVPNVSQLAKQSLSATVRLEMIDDTGTLLGSGNGFFVMPNIIATNYHVIQGATGGSVKTVGQHRRFAIEGVIAIDKENDLALLKVSGYSQGVKTLRVIRDSAKAEVGQTIYVAGHPKALEGTFTTGQISSISDKHIETNAPIAPGSSGGAVLNQAGEVIGVSLSQYTALDQTPRSFVIPANVLSKLLTETDVKATPSRKIDEITADTYFHWGYERYRQGDYQNAIHAYTMIIHLDPENVFMAHNNRGMARVMLKQYFGAIADYNTAIKLNRDYPEAYNNRGVVKMKIKQYLRAIADFDSALKRKPDLIQAIINRGAASAALGRHIEAMEDYDLALTLNPNNTEAIVNRGVAKAALGEHAAAIDDYNTAIRLNPNSATVFYYRGVAKAALGEHTAAIVNYDTAIKLDADLPDAYTQRGNAKTVLGQFMDAMADYDAAIRLNPNNPTAYYKRGVIKRIFNAKEGAHDLQTAMKYARQTRNRKLSQKIQQALVELK